MTCRSQLARKSHSLERKSLKPSCPDQTTGLSGSGPVLDKAKTTGCLEDAVRTEHSQAREAVSVFKGL